MKEIGDLFGKANPEDNREWLTSYSYRDKTTGEVVWINPTLVATPTGGGTRARSTVTPTREAVSITPFLIAGLAVFAWLLLKRKFK